MSKKTRAAKAKALVDGNEIPEFQAPVRMKFYEDKFYEDQNVPLYKKGEIYEIEPAMVTRWMKRGGEIVTDESEEEIETEDESSEDETDTGPLGTKEKE